MITPRIKLFLEFVKKQHGTQVRKYTGEPYWKHTYAVAKRIAPLFNNNEILIAVALGHDLYEDVEECTYEVLKKGALEAGFSEFEFIQIHEGITHLTDVYTSKNYPHLNRRKRKLLEAERLGRIPADIQTIKLADLEDNTKSIGKYDKDFAVVYLKEKEVILDKMRNGNLPLFFECYNILLKFKRKLAKERNKV